MEKITRNIMKVLFLLMISSSLIITGCEEDDDADPLVGTWILIEMTNGGVTLDVADLIAEDISMSVVFTSTRFAAFGNFGTDETINDFGTWERVDEKTVTLNTSGGDIVTLTRDGEYYIAPMGDEGATGKFKKQEIDPLVGAWMLVEMTDGDVTMDSDDLVAEGISMNVLFTLTRFFVNGDMGTEIVSDYGTWVRQDKNTVLLTTSDQTSVTLTRDGDYYIAPMGDGGATGKFKKQ